MFHRSKRSNPSNINDLASLNFPISFQRFPKWRSFWKILERIGKDWKGFGKTSLQKAIAEMPFVLVHVWRKARTKKPRLSPGLKCFRIDNSKSVRVPGTGLRRCGA